MDVQEQIKRQHFDCYIDDATAEVLLNRMAVLDGEEPEPAPL